jgi:hypothetical protein
MKNFSKYGIIAAVTILSAILFYNFGLANSCQIKHLTTINEIKEYQKLLDPELCDNLVNKIIELNEECDIEIEPIDCG